jgi:hypothetical protein
MCRWLAVWLRFCLEILFVRVFVYEILFGPAPGGDDTARTKKKNAGQGGTNVRTKKKKTRQLCGC